MTTKRPPADNMLVYTSAATRPMTVDDLHTLLGVSRARNAADGISGLLLHVDGAFFQVLEGPGAAVQSLYAQIRTDRRHEGAWVLLDTPISRRSFGAWSMGYAGVTRAALCALPGLSDFFVNAATLHELTPGLAKVLVQGFVDACAGGRLPVDSGC